MRHISDTYSDWDEPNPYYRRALKDNPLADTPLFEQQEIPKDGPLPPRTKPRSATQRESWDKTKQHVTERQQQVLAALRERGPSTTADLSEFLEWTINLVSGRISELTRLGYVVEAGSILNHQTGRHNSLWRAV